jgi:hypothetical protein
MSWIRSRSCQDLWFLPVKEHVRKNQKKDMCGMTYPGTRCSWVHDELWSGIDDPSWNFQKAGTWKENVWLGCVIQTGERNFTPSINGLLRTQLVHTGVTYLVAWGRRTAISGWYGMFFVPFLSSFAKFFKPSFAPILPWHSVCHAPRSLDCASVPEWLCCIFIAHVPATSVWGVSQRWILWSRVSGTV